MFNYISRDTVSRSYSMGTAMKKLSVFFFLWFLYLASSIPALSAARFWVAQPISGAIVSVASPPQVRLTVSSTTGMTTGDVRTVFGVGGTTEANGTWTITVIDGTHIDLQGTTFANLYTSGGSVYGKWDATNTNNWVTTSGGTNYGQTVPGAADTATFDGSSGGGIIIPNVTINMLSMTWGAFTGTIDFSVNNNNVTLNAATATTAFSGTGSATRSFNMGNGTWTITTPSNAGVSTTSWNMTTVTGLTWNANSSTIVFSGASLGSRTFAGGGLTYNNLTLAANSSGGPTIVTGANTFATLTVAGLHNVILPSGSTTTATALSITGTSSAPISITTSATNNTVATISVASGSYTFDWTTLRGLTFTGGATFAATNSLDQGSNTGISITAPSGGGGGSGGRIIGG